MVNAVGKPYRTVIFGIDGLSWSVYRALRGHGYLSALAELEARAVKGSIEAIPPLTPPIWTSITSGVNPGKHGIYFFHLTDRYGRTIRLHNALDVKHPRIHDIASYNGLQSLVVNLPLSSWPRIPFRGALISDWLSPKDYAIPQWLHEILIREKTASEKEYPEEECKHIKRDIAILNTLLKAGDKIFNDKHYVFIMLEYLDATLHQKPDEAYNPKLHCLKEALELTNELLNNIILPYALDDGTIIVVSDHGNDKARYRISIPRILYDAGLIKTVLAPIKEGLIKNENTKQPLVAKIISKAMKYKPIGKLITKLGRRLVMYSTIARKIAIHVERPVPDEQHSPVIIPREWNYGIYINERMVSDVRVYIRKVINVLREAERELGHKFIHNIVEARNKLFKGPFTETAPHIMVIPRKGYSFASTNIYAPPIDFMPKSPGSHHPENMHLVATPSSEPLLEELAMKIEQPWDYAIIAYISLLIPLPSSHDSSIIGKIKIKYPSKNYVPRYRMVVRLVSRLKSV